ncbi:hypothetical protein NP493_53g09027 [Ridgeia piscesae]|uniref:SUEL-type lectin domain-containing protein n=1 Tax=Ridgeia piscesae TaxID=27915 RepID=A0AAD9UJ45_RIDPI|nr:hypothetical protein NP493_53g09027 [Ridgeia piscesae]
MRQGRCITADYAMRCQNDVKHYLDQKCSGRQHCHVLVGTLDTVAQPCPKDLKSFLEVKYECVKVSHTDECQRYNATQLSPQTGYLALRRIASKAIQTPTCCWTVRGRPGQIVEVTLLRLGAPASQSKRRGTSSFCPRYVTVKENAVEKRIDVCEYGAREHMFYKSSFHTIQICADDKKQDDPDIARMLFYKVSGCVDIRPPRGATMQRHGDNAVVVCNSTQETWYMTCKDGVWIGVPTTNCTSRSRELLTSPETQSGNTFQHGIFLAVTIGALLGAVVGGCMLITVCLLRNSNRQRAPLANTSCVDELPYGRETDPRDFVHYPPLVCHEKTRRDGSTTAEYIHVFNCAGDRPAAVEGYTFDEFAAAKEPADNSGYKSLRVLKTRPDSAEETNEAGRRLPPAYLTVEPSKHGGDL